MTGYVVMVAPGRVGRVWGDTLCSVETEQGPIVYRGIDRDAWLDVDDLGAGQLDQALRDARRAMQGQGDGFSPGVCADVDMAEAMMRAVSAGRPEAELVWIDNASAAAPHDLAFLGYDCFVDGYGSLLRLGMYTKPDVFADAVGMVNVYGLCPTREALHGYVRLYHERDEQAVLEIVEPAMVSEACIFRIFGRVGS